MNSVGATVVAFVLIANMARGQPIAGVLAALLIGGGLSRLWVRAGRSRGIADVVAKSEHDGS